MVKIKGGLIPFLKAKLTHLVVLLLTLLLLPVLYVIINWAYISIRNYYGYCTYSPPPGSGRSPIEVWDDNTRACHKSPVKDDVLGRRFTTEERLDIAINYYLCNQKNIDYRWIKDAENMREYSMDDIKNQFTLIPYGGKSEFIQENPACCDLIPHPSQQDIFGYELLIIRGNPSSGNERASGMGNGRFAFKHKVRYLDRERNRKEVKTTKTYISVSNCGFPTNDFISESIGY